MSVPQLGKVGVWSMDLRFADHALGNEAAAEADDLGYGAIWIPGGIDGEVLPDVERMLAVTKRAVIATGIINIWKHEPQDVAGWFKGLPDSDKARVMLGIGISHAPIIGGGWDKPVARTREFLDALEGAGMAMDNTCLAALGPKMLALSGERTAGTHPYLVTPDHSATARKILGPGKLVAPEQGVVMETDPDKARETAREAVDMYRSLPNYCNNWLRLGFTQDDIDKASDRLMDGLFAWGGADKVAERVKAHHSAGADHVCVQVVGTDLAGQRAGWRELAGKLL